MKKIMFSILMYSMLVFVVSCGGNASKNQESMGQEAVIHEFYTCSMHPEVHSDKPGKCPKCGMDLIRKEGSATDSMMMDEPLDTMIQK